MPSPPRCARRTRRSAWRPAQVEVIGVLPTYTTVTGFIVTPVVGLVLPGVTLKPDPFEVAEVFEVPLALLMDPAHHQRHAVDIAGVRARVPVDALARRRCRGPAAALLHLGRHRGDAAQPLPLSCAPEPRGRRDWSRHRRYGSQRPSQTRSVSSIAMSFFAVLFALLLEQVKPLPRSNVVHDALTGWMRWTARNFDAGRDSHAWVVWCVTALAPALLTWAVFFGLGARQRPARRWRSTSPCST